MSACLGWDVSTLGSDVSTIGVGAATPRKFTLGDCAAVSDLCTLGGGGFGGMQVFVIRSIQDLRHFLLSIFFGLGCSSTVVNWDELAHFWKSSQSSVIALNCVSKVIFGAYFRSQ